MDKKVFCLGPAPLLWKGLFLLVPLLVLVFLVLVFYICIRVWRNRKKKQQIIDCRLKIYLLWLAIVFLSLIAYGIIGPDFQLYTLVFFIFFFLVLIGFYLGERWKLYMIRDSRWIIVTALIVIFGIFFLINWVERVGQAKMGNSATQSLCKNGQIF